MNEQNSTRDVERRLAGYFEGKRKSLKAPDDLWASIEPKLEPLRLEQRPAGSWLSALFGGRLRLAGAVAAVLLLLAASATGVFMARQFAGGPPALAPAPSPALVAPGLTAGGGADAAAESREKAAAERREKAAAGRVGEPGFAPPPEAPPAPTGLAGQAAPQMTAPAAPTAAGAVPPPAPPPARAPGVVPSAVPAPPLPAATPPPPRVAAPTPAPRLAVPAPATPSAPGGALDAVQRQIISSASVSIEVTAVGPAADRLAAIAGELGGFVEQLSRSGPPSAGEQEQATAVLRVPQARFAEALSRLEALGKIQSQSLRSEDVTERFIDLEARLKTFQQEEQSLLALLGRTQSVSEIVTVERELARVRTEIERIQGQLNFMKRRVELATITVNLFAPARKAGLPPSAALTVEVSGVDRSVAEARVLAASVNGSVDQVFLSRREGRDSASINLRVFRPDFGRVVEAVERQGELVQKDLREGAGGEAGAAPVEKPDAPVTVTYVQPEKPPRDWLKVTLIAAVGLLFGLAGLLLHLGWCRRAQASR